MTSNPSQRYAGLDIGGTKIAAALVDGRGRLLRSLREPTPSGGIDAVLTVAAGLVERLADDTVVDAVGVGAPGVVDLNTGSVRSATNVLAGWAGAEVGLGLQDRTGLPVVVDNDVRAMAYGEAELGAGQGFEDVLYVSVGTGIGGAITRGGRLVYGAHDTAGAIAHLLVPAAGAWQCGCGRHDHLEALVSGPAIAAAYARESGVAGTPLPDIMKAMRAGDGVAAATLRDAAGLLGRALAGLLAAIDVHAVVVGGGVAQVGTDFLDPLRTALRAEALPTLCDVPVMAAQLGTDAPLIGAALLARDRVAADRVANDGAGVDRPVHDGADAERVVRC